MSLLDRRILIVTGKGGVGKTTLCATLGVAAARRGARTILVETTGCRRIAPLFGARSLGYEVLELQRNLFTMSVTPKEAIEDYIVQQLHFRRLYKMIFENRVMGPFIDAVPGLHDVVQLGKVWDLERQQRRGRPAWDLIIVDSPATGHGLTLLDSPAAMSDLTRSGPMHRAVVQVQDLIEDESRTALLLVSLPETIPVSETIELHDALPERVRSQVAAIVLNEVWERRQTTSEAVERLRQSPADAAQREAAQMLGQWISRGDEKDRARTRLTEGLSLPVYELPFLVDRQLEAQHLERLASSLDPLFDRGTP